MHWKHIFARKDLEMLLAEAAGEHRLHRVLGPVALTALGVGCIIGAGIFVMTGRAAAQDAGPAVMVSYAIAGLGCAVAAFCYAEFASMAPVAGSAYTYAYTTLGEIFAWIIGWDLILEYAMGCATVASAWTHYLNKLLNALGLPQVREVLSHDPWSGGWLNLPSVVIMALVTVVLVVGIRESARTNASLVIVKLLVVIFVIVAGWGYVHREKWTAIPVAYRMFPQEKKVIPDLVKQYLQERNQLSPEDGAALQQEVVASYRIVRQEREIARLQQQQRLTADEGQRQIAALTDRLAAHLPQTAADRQAVDLILAEVEKQGRDAEAKSWGLLGLVGLNRWLIPIDDATRSPFMPYGLSGIMLGASIVFFAFIGFDSISTHAEEARRPQRDVPLAILLSLGMCTVLYVVVAAVITGMVPYPDIDIEAPIASAFAQQARGHASLSLRMSTALIAAGGLAGMTSVLLVLFLSQARIFMAMSRDGLLPKIFGTVHPRFRTPHVATIVTGVVICLTAAFTPIYKLEEMVNVGTLMAFVMVCGAVLVLRFQRPGVTRPFRCPAIHVVAPLGILINLAMMLFLPADTWARLVIWLLIGLVIYFCYGLWHSLLTQHLWHEIQLPREEATGTAFDPETNVEP
ncbi:MAG: amino acid permease [Thermoguttaceae bacterium]